MDLGFTTSAFVAEEHTQNATASSIPARYAMHGVSGGQNVSIPYSWSAVPEGTRSLAFTIVDTAPVAHRWVHWMVVDIPADVRALPEGASGSPSMPAGAVELHNSYGTAGYGGPEPPRGTGAHPYVATLYALDIATTGLPPDTSLARFEQAIAGHVLASETCTGRFGR